MFNWVDFLQRNGIPFADSGKNVARGHVNIACPFCEAIGNPDPSAHLGLRESDGAWGCLRDPRHRGKRPMRLIVALLHCSWAQAEAIVGDVPTESGFESLRQRLERESAPAGVSAPSVIRWNPEMRKVMSRGPRSIFHRYLKRRGFAEEDIAPLLRFYRLRGALSGRFKHRLCLPILTAEGMVGWTGRAVLRGMEPRYLAHPDSGVKSRLFNEGRVGRGGRWLVVVEGPLDCLKLDWYGRGIGIRSVALMGVSATEEQIGRLLHLADSFASTAILLDPGASGAAGLLASKLALLSPRLLSFSALPSRFSYAEDPGALKAGDVRPALRFLLS